MRIEDALRLSRDGGYKVLCAATRCLDVLSACFEHLLEVCSDAGEGAFERVNDLVMSERVRPDGSQFLTFLLCSPS